MATQTASSSSSSSWKYDVFLSFCGVDTCKNFTDHLYTALKQKGIVTFRDDEKLERGKYISLELLKAIEESQYAIIVLSSNYASSRWCLIELAKIVGCMKENRLTVLPVFHYVDPSHVRNQTGTLIEAFAKHEKDPKINIEDVQEWKAAMKEVGNIAGWHLHDSHEAIVIQDIVGRIFSELSLKFSSSSKEDLVGMASRVKKMLDLYLGLELGGVRFVGICGMGGSGKSTLAGEIFRRITGNFEASCFIDNVREETEKKGLVFLQQQILCRILMAKEINIGDFRGGIELIGNRLRNKKVLIVLDDVDEEEQLEALAGKHDWFGDGSRIIVTSRDSHLLRRHGVDDVFTTKGLNNDEALELFSWRAFKKRHPEENYVDLSEDFVNYTNGLPLALKVLGSLLFGKSMDAWKSARDQLKVVPDSDKLVYIIGLL
ncbi:TMV resistance protein N-like [Fagus crenata]